jgi:hypothetical protein
MSIQTPLLSHRSIITKEIQKRNTGNDQSSLSRNFSLQSYERRQAQCGISDTK